MGAFMGTIMGTIKGAFKGAIMGVFRGAFKEIMEQGVMGFLKEIAGRPMIGGKSTNNTKITNQSPFWILKRIIT